MTSKRGLRWLISLMVLVLCMTAFSVTAFAYSGEDDYYEPPVETTEATDPAGENTDTETGDGIPLTPDGNMTLVDDIEGEDTADKQFITVVSKSGNYFYIIIDRADDGENTVHFLNQVDEADLMALMEEGQTEETPIICSCTEKCAAGAVKTDCKICMTNMSECVGKEAEPVEPAEPEEPADENSGNVGAVIAVVLILAAAGGGAAYYFFVMKPKQAKKVPDDLDDFDLEDEEYVSDNETEDVE